MSSAKEIASHSTPSNLAELLPQTTNKPQLAEIVVFSDNRNDAASILEFAGLIAEENGARLINMFIRPDPSVSPPQEFARGEGIREVIETHQSQLESIEQRHRARFDDVVRRHRIRQPEWRSMSQWSNEVAIQAYYADLVIIARPEPAGKVPGPSGLAESLVLSAGRPVILFPSNHTASRVRRVLLSWSATREAIRAAVDALPLIARAEAVEVLIFDYERQRERHGENPGADAARRISALGVHVEVQRMSSEGQDVGHLMLAQAGAYHADLLVMGAYGHSTLHEWLFGGVTRTVLYEASLPVLMSR